VKYKCGIYMFQDFNVGSFNRITGCDDLVILCDEPPEDATLLSKHTNGSLIYMCSISCFCWLLLRLQYDEQSILYKVHIFSICIASGARRTDSAFAN
jgi:hypothetical protein